MNIDLNQLQEEATKETTEELEQQGQDPQPEPANEPANEPAPKKERRKLDLNKAVAGSAILLSSTALGVNLMKKPECAPNDTTALTSLQQENEELKQENQVLQASRKRRNRDFTNLRDQVVDQEGLNQLKEKATTADELQRKLTEQEQYSKQLEEKLRQIERRRNGNKRKAESRQDYKTSVEHHEKHINRLKELLNRINERRKSNKDNAQSRQDYKEWLREILEEGTWPATGSISGFQWSVRSKLPGEEGETAQPITGISGTLTTKLGGEEGQDLGHVKEMDGSLWLTSTAGEMDQLSRILTILMSLDDTAFAYVDEKGKQHEYKTKQGMLDYTEQWLGGFLRFQNEVKEREGE